MTPEWHDRRVSRRRNLQWLLLTKRFDSSDILLNLNTREDWEILLASAGIGLGLGIELPLELEEGKCCRKSKAAAAAGLDAGTSE